MTVQKLNHACVVHVAVFGQNFWRSMLEVNVDVSGQGCQVEQ